MSIVSQNAIKHDFFTRQVGFGGKFRHAGRLFMQNKPNSLKGQINASSIITNTYGNESAFGSQKNKANQTQFPRRQDVP